MSMVKPYHGKKCSDLQLCCSSWMPANTFPRDDLLIRETQMEGQDENWTWENSTDSCNKMEVWNDDVSDNLKYIPLDPPLEFQDDPVPPAVEKFAADFISKLISDVFLVSCKITWSIPCSQDCHMSDSLPVDNSVFWNGLRLCWTPELLPYKHPCLSASHNSLSTISSSNMDDSSYIKSAVSHDVLTTKQISDMYNVPFDSDIYAVPVDMVQGKGPNAPSRSERCYQSPNSPSDHYMLSVTSSKKSSSQKPSGRCRKSDSSSSEPIHVTVEEVRQYLHSLYSSSNETPEGRNFQETVKRLKNPFKSLQNNGMNNEANRLKSLKTRRNYGKAKKAKENVDTSGRDYNKLDASEKFKKSSTCRPSFSTNIKETLCNIFRIKKLPSPDHCLGRREIGPRSDEIGMRLSGHDDQNPPSPITKPPFSKRALPPVPRFEDKHGEIIVTDSTPLPSPEEVPPPSLPFRSKEPTTSVDFASSIEKVKDYGWYWGPISGEAAEKILSNEPDGSFIVRDSSDDYYIFSLTFKLNSIIRHVRIEHDKGNFSFGNSTRFKSHTIVDFIESAVEHSRSGRYLFFLHRRPVLGPMRVQLLHPVSRFKEVQSLQHMCRFVILKMVRRDLIQYLPLPRRVLDYLSTQHYYTEHLTEDEGKDSSGEDLDQLLPFRQEVFS